MADFVTVGRASEIDEGTMEMFEVGELRITVANVAGTFHAFDDTCTHRECSLAEGELDGGIVECACHGSQFDVTTGNVVEGPATEPIGTYDARVEGDDLQVAP